MLHLEYFKCIIMDDAFIIMTTLARANLSMHVSLQRPVKQG
jgi:hypothetical protein